MGRMPRREFLKRASVLAAGAAMGVDLSSCSDGANPADPPGPPAAPTDLEAAALSAGTISLSWIDATDDETGFRVERSRGGEAFATAGTAPADATGFVDSGLDPDTEYAYRVLAFNDAGDSAPSAIRSAKTLGPADFRPNAPSGVTATAVSSTSVRVDWTDNSDNEDLFRIERKPEGGEYAVAGSAPPGAATFTDDSVVPDTAYTYRVFATNAKGDSDPGGEASTRTPLEPPGPPTGVVVTALSSSGIRVAFQPGVTGGPASEYRIERRKGATGEFLPAGTVPGDGRAFEDTGLEGRQEYFYRLRGANAAGAGPYTRDVLKATTWFAVLYSEAPEVQNVGGLYCADLPRERGEYRLAIYRVSRMEAVAYDRTCTHQQNKIGCADRDDAMWTCPWHGSTFALDGRRLDGAALSNLPRYTARVAPDRIEVLLAPFSNG